MELLIAIHEAAIQHSKLFASEKSKSIALEYLPIN